MNTKRHPPTFCLFLFLLFTSVCATEYTDEVSASGVTFKKLVPAPTVAELESITNVLGARKYNVIGDGRYFPTTDQEFVDYVNHVKDYDNGYAQVYGFYYLDLNLAIPDDFWRKNAAYYYLYYMDWSNVTGAASLPEIPANPDNFARLYFNVRRGTNNSMGSAGIDDVPTSWRNAKSVYTFYFQRQELTSAQQTGIVKGIEREILAGMSEDYTSTSTTTRIIGFNSSSSGRNAALDKTDLLADGWTVSNSTTLQKNIVNPKNGVAYRWRVLHLN